MKRLAHFTLEGLLQQGPHQVWITLGQFASECSALQAAGDLVNVKPGVTETRVLPLYMDDGGCRGDRILAVQRGSVQAPAAEVTLDSVTVA